MINLKTIGAKAIKLLKIAWSKIPLFALTDDNNFGTNENTENQSFRFSFLNIMLGSILVYFLTYNFKEKQFKFIFILKLEEVNALKIDTEKIAVKAADYTAKHLSHLSENDIMTEKEFILYSVDNQNKRVDTSFNKMNFYTFIILALIPILVSSVSLDTLLNLSFISQFMLLMIVYGLVNAFLLVINFMKVKGKQQSLFDDLKQSLPGRSKTSQLQYNYYYDWQILRAKATIFVSYVKNTENWIIFFIVMFVIFISTMSITSMNLGNDFTPSQPIIYTIDIDKLDNPYGDNCIILNKVHLEIKEKKPSKVVIITSSKISKDNLENIKSDFNIYNQRAKIVYYTDSSISGKEIKILLEED